MPSSSILGSGQVREREENYYGVVIGIVSNIDDPDKVGRVKVNFPWLNSQEESNWARICQFMAGNDRGSWFIPEVGDEVLVAFEHGDIDHPFVIGSLFNGEDTPPGENDHSADNNIRMIKSRSGHVIKLDDSSGSEQVEIKTSSGDTALTMKSDGSITISSGTITIEGTKEINLKSKTINIEADQNLNMKSSTNFKLTASAAGSVESSATLTIKGSVVNIN